MSGVRDWIERSPYAASLGVELLSLAESGRVRLRLPYRDENSNGDTALHGGVSASMIGGIGCSSNGSIAIG